MSIDIFYEGDDRPKTPPRFSLRGSSHTKLDDVWLALEKRTGIFLDPYGHTILERGQIELLCRLLERSFKTQVPDEDGSQLLRFLSSALKRGVNALHFEGD